MLNIDAFQDLEIEQLGRLEVVAVEDLEHPEALRVAVYTGNGAHRFAREVLAKAVWGPGADAGWGGRCASCPAPHGAALIETGSDAWLKSSQCIWGSSLCARGCG